MNRQPRAMKERLNDLLLRVGKVPAVLMMSVFSVAMSVLLAWAGTFVFAPGVEVSRWLYMTIIVPSIVAPIVTSAVVSLAYQLAEAKAALVTMSETDPLTGVGNRRNFWNSAGQAVSAVAAGGRPLCIVLIDIDNFKRLNDWHGHAVGDDALITVAHTVRAALRPGDVICRWGGEEFILLLPATSLNVACRFAERLRVKISASFIPGVSGSTTVSLGVAELSSGGQTLDEVIMQADRQLYLAKQTGRNKVCPFAEQQFMLVGSGARSASA